jgi:kynurenine 3-monooxygenase
LKPKSDQPVSIVGAGLAGALFAIMLARRGFAVRLYDRRPDPRRAPSEGGRSINLALAARGIRALEHAGVMERIRPLLIPMRGRMVHDLSALPALQPYGQREHEVIYSVGRAALNRVLIEEATRHADVTVLFDQACLAVNPLREALRFRDEITGHEYEVTPGPAIATDGAGSVVRSSLAAAGYLKVKEEFLDHDYKELTLPAAAGKYALEPNALHIWPRGGFMLIALPNTDGSFTATLFLPRTGERSFASLATGQAVEEFFRQQFPDVVPLIPNLFTEFREHPQGQLGTVHTVPWHVGRHVLLLGDAAHAIVPFHGQGMNAAFEDCLVFDSLLDRHDDWEPLFDEVEQVRRPDTAAIARMALENYTEMRDTVLDAKFVRQKAVALELERLFPRRFIPRYAMVMFHPEIAYAEALRRGAVQAQVLDELDARPDPAGGTDLRLAEQLITERLPPLS